MKHRVLAIFTALVIGMVSFSVLASVGPRKLVEDTTELIITRLTLAKDEIKRNPERASQLVNEVVLPHFDFESMAKKTLGKYWSKSSEAQRERFMKEYKQLLIRTYSKVLADNLDSQINFLVSRTNKKDPDKIMVRTRVDREEGFPIPINYKMRKVDGNWKVYDVVIDEISMASNYRSSFTKQIKQSGIDKLIASLAENNKDK